MTAEIIRFSDYRIPRPAPQTDGGITASYRTPIKSDVDAAFIEVERAMEDRPSDTNGAA